MRGRGRGRRWHFAAGRGDFLPIVVGGVMVFVSWPAFFLLLFAPESNPGIFWIPLLVILGAGAVFGAAFVIRGIQMCAPPGSLAYRIAHGRFFSR
jgi:hypothetical protein